MAFVSNTPIISPVQGVVVKPFKALGSVVLKAAKSVGKFFIAMAEANSRSQTVKMLQSKTDRQLADMGIKRADIVAHVFRDKMYL